MVDVGRLEARIGMNTAMLRRDTARATGMFQGFSRKSTASFGSVIKQARLLQVAVAAIGGAAVFRVFKSITKIGADFQQTITEAGAVMRATSGEMDALTAAARRMGETTEWTASQAAGSLKFLGMAGFDATKAMTALPGTLDLATAGGIELGRAADIATNALTAMGLDVEELGRVNDVFVGTITRSNTNMEMMAESFKYAAPVARAYGYSIEELSGLIGMLGNAGIQASMAGTALARAIMKSAQVAARMKMESSDLVDVIEELRNRGYSAVDMMKIFDIRSAKVASVLFNATKQTKAFQETLGNVGGEAKALADKMRSTLGGAFKVLKSVIESVALDSFEKYSDRLRHLITELIDLIQRYKDTFARAFGAMSNYLVEIGRGLVRIVTEVKAAFDTFTNFIQNFGKEVEKAKTETAKSLEEIKWNIMLAFAPPDLSAWDTALGYFKIWHQNVGAIFLALPKIAAIALAATALAVKKTFERIAEASKGLAFAVAAAFSGRIGGVKSGIDTMLAAFENIDNDIKAVGAAATIEVKKLLIDLARAIETGSPAEVLAAQWDAAYRAMTRSMQSIIDKNKEAVHTAKDVGSAAGQSAEETAAAVQKLNQMLELQVDMYRELLTEAQRTGQGVAQAWEQYRQARMEQIGAEYNAMAKLFRDTGRGIEDLIGVMKYAEQQMAALTREGQEIMAAVDIERINRLNEALKKQGQIYKSILDAGQKTGRELRQIWEAYKEERIRQIREEFFAMRNMLATAGLDVKAAVDYMLLQLRRLNKESKDIFEETGNDLVAFARDVAQGMRYAFSNFFFDVMTGEITKLKDLLNSLWAAIARAVSERAAAELILNIPFLGKVAEAQHGMLATQPQLAMIGEVPEAVVPLHRMNDPRFWQGLGLQAPNAGGGNNINVTMNVATPDVGSFKASMSQIMGQVAATLRRADDREL